MGPSPSFRTVIDVLFFSLMRRLRSCCRFFREVVLDGFRRIPLFLSPFASCSPQIILGQCRSGKTKWSMIFWESSKCKLSFRRFFRSEFVYSFGDVVHLFLHTFHVFVATFFSRYGFQVHIEPWSLVFLSNFVHSKNSMFLCRENLKTIENIFVFVSTFLRFIFNGKLSFYDIIRSIRWRAHFSWEIFFYSLCVHFRSFALPMWHTATRKNTFPSNENERILS